MTKEKALKIIMLVALGGVLFSGYLSYQELFAGSCDVRGVSCGTNEIAGLPACVYGFFMYSIVLTVAYLGQKAEK